MRFDQGTVPFGLVDSITISYSDYIEYSSENLANSRLWTVGRPGWTTTILYPIAASRV